MKTLINWCDISYTAQWKDIEEKTFPFPIQATLADRDIQKHTDIADNPWVECTLSVWKNVVKEYELEKDIMVLK